MSLQKCLTLHKVRDVNVPLHYHSIKDNIWLRLAINLISALRQYHFGEQRKTIAKQRMRNIKYDTTGLDFKTILTFWTWSRKVNIFSENLFVCQIFTQGIEWSQKNSSSKTNKSLPSKFSLRGPFPRVYQRYRIWIYSYKDTYHLYVFTSVASLKTWCLLEK